MLNQVPRREDVWGSSTTPWRRMGEWRCTSTHF